MKELLQVTILSAQDRCRTLPKTMDSDDNMTMQEEGLTMLKVFKSMQGLDFSQLMRVYEAGNIKTAEVCYPNEDVNIALLQTEQEFYRYLCDIFFRTEGALYAVWELQGRYVSALRLEPYRDGFLLAALETALSDRRKGYASDLLSAVLQYLEESGADCVYSHVRKNNQPSIRIHVRCGFRCIHEYAAYIDGSVSRDAYTYCLHVDP